MVRRPSRLGLDLLLVVAAATWGAARGEAQIDTVSAITPDPDLAETWEELSSAGAPPTAAEWAALVGVVADIPDGDAQRTIAKAGTGWSGYWRSGWRDEGVDLQGRCAGQAGGVRLLVRVRRRPQERVAGSGGVHHEGGVVQFGVGDFGLTQGYGLLAAAPGRGATIAPDHSLLTVRRGYRVWSGQGDGRTVRGGAAGLCTSGLNLRLLVGDAAGDAVQAAQISAERRAWRSDVLLLRRGAARGISLALSARKGDGRLAAEVAQWRNDDHVTGGAAVAAVAWRSGRDLTFEVSAGQGTGSPPPLLAGRPAVLSGWDGHGYLMRLAVRAAAHARIYLLLRDSRHRERGVALRRVSRSLFDLVLMHRTGSHEVSGRWRRTQEAVDAWSDRYPWEAAQPQVVRVQAVGSLRWQAEWGGGRLTALWRTHAENAAFGDARRHLLSFSWRRAAAASLGWRGGWAMAWGDDVDLVSAVVPLHGYVLARHWGRWREEFFLGLESGGSAVILRLAGSLRRPARVADMPYLAAWLELAWRW